MQNWCTVYVTEEPNPQQAAKTCLTSPAKLRRSPQSEPPLMFDDSEEVVMAARAFGWEAASYDRLEDFTSHPWVAERLGDG